MGNKYRVIANVHEGGVWLANVKQLEAIIRRAYNTVDPAASVSIVWMRLPRGSMFLAGEPSTTSTVVTPMPDYISQESREQFMHSVCQDWMNITGCDINEIIVNAMNQSGVSAYIALNQARFNPKRFKKRMLKSLAGALWKKRKCGYLSFTLNLKS